MRVLSVLILCSGLTLPVSGGPARERPSLTSASGAPSKTDHSLLQTAQYTSMEGRLTSDGPHAKSHTATIDSTLIHQIFFMCVVMYGGIAVLWGVNVKSGSPESARVALLCVSWSSTSVGMHVLNKALVGYLHAPALISAFQMGLTVVVVFARSWSELKGAPAKQLLQWMVVPVFFSGMLISAFYAYEKISLTLLTLVRNLTPLLMLPLESLVMTPENRPTVTLPVVIGILTMLAGALVYSGGNMASISIIGVAFAVLNMFLAVTDRLIQRRLLTTECRDLSSTLCTLLNNFFGMIPTLLLGMVTGQVSEAMGPENRSRWAEPQVLVLLLVSGLVGTGISILGLECQRAISATSFSVMQNASKIAVVSAGIVFFLDPIGSSSSVLGLCLSLGGSFLYARAQQQVSAKASEKAAENGAAAKTA